MKIDNGFDLNKTNFPEVSKQSKELNGSFEARLQKAMDVNDEKTLKKACTDFENMFMQIMYKQMRATVIKSDLVPQSNAREIFESMMDDKLAEESSKAGGIGLGDMLFKQMKKEMANIYKKT